MYVILLDMFHQIQTKHYKLAADMIYTYISLIIKVPYITITLFL